MPETKPRQGFEKSTEIQVKKLLREAKDFEERAKAVGLAIKWASVKNRIPATGYGDAFTEEEDGDGT